MLGEQTDTVCLILNLSLILQGSLYLGEKVVCVLVFKYTAMLTVTPHSQKNNRHFKVFYTQKYYKMYKPRSFFYVMPAYVCAVGIPVLYHLHVYIN